MSSPLEDAQKITSIWADYAAKMAGAGVNFEPCETMPSDAGKQMRDAALGAMSQYAQQFLRSEQFLEMMKRTMDASIEWRQRMNEFLTAAQHSMQGVAQRDVTDLHGSVHHLEQRTLDRLEQLSAKLEEVSRRLEAMERQARGSNGARRLEGSERETGAAQ